MHTSNKNKYALLIVLEYNEPKINDDCPSKLPSMDIDLYNSWMFTTNRLNIPLKNITIVTDIEKKIFCDYPWDVWNRDGPFIIRIKHPDISVFVRELSCFIGKKHESSDGEFFIYISCHGGLIPNYPEDSNALILTTPDGRKRQYLRSKDINNIIFCNVPFYHDGRLEVPIVQRCLKVGKNGDFFYQFDDFILNYYIPTNIGYNGELNVNVKLLCIVDSCFSGNMVDFPYKYDQLLCSSDICYTNPIYICISSSDKKSISMSSQNGSPFSEYLFGLLSINNYSMNLEQLYELIYKHIPNDICLLNPKISMTFTDKNIKLPLL